MLGNRPRMGYQRRSADPRAIRNDRLVSLAGQPPPQGPYAYGTPPNRMDPAAYSAYLDSYGFYNPRPVRPQQQAPQFQMPQLGDFFQSHGMGDAQNTANSTIGMNFGYSQRQMPGSWLNRAN